MNFADLFEEFLQAGLYLKGWSTKTPVIYRRAWASFQASQRESAVCKPRGNDAPLTKADLEAWVVFMRRKGNSPACINIYVRAMNAFCSWLHEQGHLAQPLKMKQVPAPLKPVIVFSEADIKALLSFRPQSYEDHRLSAVVQTLLDTGCRINEVLTLRNQDIDFDSCLFLVNGKGGKTRKVPFSMELRRTLWRFKQLHEKRFAGRKMDLLFCCRNGQTIRYRNIYRDIINLCREVGITKRVHCHLTRHTFACHFMKNGGSIYSLSRILGHSSVTTTQTYIRGLGVEDFREEHARLTPLARVR